MKAIAQHLPIHFSAIQRQEAVLATSTLSIPVPEGVEKPASPKIEKIVSEITNLNLLEVSELSQVLKKRLNLPDAPMMPAGGFFAGAPALQDEEEAVPKAVKTNFTVSRSSTLPTTFATYFCLSYCSTGGS